MRILIKRLSVRGALFIFLTNLMNVSFYVTSTIAPYTNHNNGCKIDRTAIVIIMIMGP